MKLLLLLSALAATALAAPAPGTIATSEYPRCGGRRGLQCPEEGQVCIDNPYGCSQAVDCLGICVAPRVCGGFLGIGCPAGQRCVDDPRDDCDPHGGGSDCEGLCA